MNIDSALYLDRVLLKKFNYQDWNLANAAGASNSPKDYIELQYSQKEEDSLYVMAKRQLIYNRLIFTSTELASIAAELDCKSERSKQLANYLDPNDDSKVQKLTIISVITGAATAIITSVGKNRNTQIGFGVSVDKIKNTVQNFIKEA